MREVMRSRWAVLATVLGLALAGCGDSNLFESQSSSSGTQSDLEAGLEALDSGNWAEAQRIFSGMDQNDPEVRKYLASAYVGEAGFDVLTLVEQLDAAQQNGDSGDAIYDSVTAIFDDDGDGTLTTGELNAKLGLVEQALAALGAIELPEQIPGRIVAAEVAHQNLFQIGLYSALDAVLLIVEQLVEPGSEDLLLTLEALEQADACQVIGPVPAVEGDGGLVAPETFDELLANVRTAVEVIVPDFMGGQFDNEIAEELDEFLTDIAYFVESEGEGPNAVTSTELRSYIYTLFDNTCIQ